MTKVAAHRTAGVLGDDLALNAEQVSGVRAEREIPVVWAVAKKSARNKLILIPIALLLSAFLPILITPLLMIGGAYLCFEGFEKLSDKFLHPDDVQQKHQAMLSALRHQHRYYHDHRCLWPRRRHRQTGRSRNAPVGTHKHGGQETGRRYSGICTLFYKITHRCRYSSHVSGRRRHYRPRHPRWRSVATSSWINSAGHRTRGLFTSDRHCRYCLWGRDRTLRFSR